MEPVAFFLREAIHQTLKISKPAALSCLQGPFLDFRSVSERSYSYLALPTILLSPLLVR